jgi:hypothetical protein
MNGKMITYFLSVGLISTTCVLGADEEDDGIEYRSFCVIRLPRARAVQLPAVQSPEELEAKRIATLEYQRNLQAVKEKQEALAAEERQRVAAEAAEKKRQEAEKRALEEALKQEKKQREAEEKAQREALRQEYLREAGDRALVKKAFLDAEASIFLELVYQTGNLSQEKLYHTKLFWEKATEVAFKEWQAERGVDEETPVDSAWEAFKICQPNILKKCGFDALSTTIQARESQLSAYQSEVPMYQQQTEQALASTQEAADRLTSITEKLKVKERREEEMRQKMKDAKRAAKSETWATEEAIAIAEMKLGQLKLDLKEHEQREYEEKRRRIREAGMERFHKTETGVSSELEKQLFEAQRMLEKLIRENEEMLITLAEIK